MIGKYFAWLPLVCVLACGGAGAQGVSPDVMVKNVTDEVLTILRQDKGIKSGNHQRVAAVIESKVAPHFDFARMTSQAVGRAWRQADERKRQALITEFRALLVRTYANALSAYRDQTVSFKPSAARKSAGDEVTVQSQINSPGAQPIALDYTLAKSGEDWKVVDVVIGNVSLVTNYRGSFASEIDKGGLDGLLQSLQEKNRYPETASAT
jgi:phospholipid transport system substrate-binding protein